MQQKDTATLIQHGGHTSGLNLGGIGTGGVEIWPDGRFHHWNMLNTQPWANMHGSDTPARHIIDEVVPYTGHTDFFVRVQEKGKRPVYRWLFTGNGDIIVSGHFFRHHKLFFIKSTKEIEYRAEYPFAYLKYVNPDFPVDVELRAWTAFVPRNVKDSSLPGAFLDFKVRNKTNKKLEVSLVWQQQNLSGWYAPEIKQKHTKQEISNATAVRMEGSLTAPEFDTSGCMTIWAKPKSGQKVTAVAANPYMPNLIWPVHRTGDLEGPLMPERLDREEITDDPTHMIPNKGWLCVKQSLKPKAEKEIQMGMTWYYPNHVSIHGTKVGHMYANWFKDSADVAGYMIRKRKKLLQKSLLMPTEMMQSNLPERMKLSILDQINTLTKSTHFIKSGRFGLQEGHGCCAFNTMDVDHYSSYGLSILMPALRETVLDMQTEIADPETGKIHHGLPGSVEEISTDDKRGYRRWDCSVQYILQVYRDAKWAGNRELMERCWPAAKRAMEVIIDLDFYNMGLPYTNGGITYDHWHMKGLVTYMVNLYLAALKAIEDMADNYMNEPETAERMRDLYEKGRKSMEEHFWNGQQYLLFYDIRSNKCEEEEGELSEDQYFKLKKPRSCCDKPENCVEIRDTGLMTDAINGHTTAQVMGLGPILKKSRVKKHLQLVMKRNAQDETQAVVNGTYPDGHFLDGFPFMQWQTPWTGTEYFLSAQLYCNGLVKEGDKVIDMVFDRHVREGMRFDQSECSNHYARPLSIFAAYAARLGLDIDEINNHLSIIPPTPENAYEGLLLTSVATGRLKTKSTSKKTATIIEILDGQLNIKTLTLASKGKPKKLTVKRNGKSVPASHTTQKGKTKITFQRKIALKKGNTLKITLQ